MQTSAKSILLAILILTLALTSICACALFGRGEPAFAAEGGYQVRFYADENTPPYAEILVTASGWAFPAAPEKEGFTFVGWLQKGGLGKTYAAGELYMGALTADTAFSALWEPVIKAEEKEPFFKPWEWAVFVSAIAVMLGLIAFVYYKRVIKKPKKKNSNGKNTLEM